MRESTASNPMRNNRTNRSLLGIPDRNDSAARYAQIQDEQLMERENDKDLEELHSKIKVIKDISKDIETGISEGNKRLDSLDTEMNGAQALLKNTMKKLNTLAQSGSNRQMCYLILFVVFVFILVYFIITRTSKSSENPPSM